MSAAAPPSLAEAFEHCARVVRAHYENFPVGSTLAPKALRPHLHSVYAFARGADDFADEAAYEGRRLALLDEWEDRLDRCLRGNADHPVFVALAETIRVHALPDRPFRDLLDAFRQDCRVRRYADWEALLDYCRRSADPVGRIVLRLYGYRDEALVAPSDAICTGLQLTNFWQDVAVDLAKDRIYLPQTELTKHRVSEADLAQPVAGPGVRALILDVVARTRGFFERGRPLLREVGGRLGFELRAVHCGGLAILDRIECLGGDVLGSRPVLGTGARAGIVLRAALGIAS
jgi:phytoene synthase